MSLRLAAAVVGGGAPEPVLASENGIDRETSSPRQGQANGCGACKMVWAQAADSMRVRPQYQL
eukprot:7253646-Lingulodinium_polyedra.AAC.1